MAKFRQASVPWATGTYAKNHAEEQDERDVRGSCNTDEKAPREGWRRENKRRKGMRENVKKNKWEQKDGL